MEKKFALIHMGSDELYSLEFVAAEVKRLGHEFAWFDSESAIFFQEIKEYGPDFLCFSPLTTFFSRCLKCSKKIKKDLPEVKSVFGGQHVSALPEVIELDGIDIVVIGPVYGTIEKIVSSTKNEVIKGYPIELDKMMPSRAEYFTSIKRIGTRHRKMLMSHFGCPYNCSYCSTSRVRKEYGPELYKKYWLTRRPIENLIEEAKVFLQYPTAEVDFCDDDLLFGKDIETWLPEFSKAWKQEINLPIYGFVSPLTVVKTSDKLLRTLADLVDTVAMGVQAARYESLKLFNRHFQTEEIVKKAFDRLKAFGIPAKIEMIIGLPVKDPIEDALETVKLGQRIGAGTFGAVFPLMLYPGTKLYTWCKEKQIPLEEDCDFDFYGGIGSVKFEPNVRKKIRNLVKLGAFFIKYNIDERWMKALIAMDLNEASARLCSENNYMESLVFRQGEQVKEQFDEILSNTPFKY